MNRSRAHIRGGWSNDLERRIDIESANFMSSEGEKSGRIVYGELPPDGIATPKEDRSGWNDEVDMITAGARAMLTDA